MSALLSCMHMLIIVTSTCQENDVSNPSMPLDRGIGNLIWLIQRALEQLEGRRKTELASPYRPLHSIGVNASGLPSEVTENNYNIFKLCLRIIFSYNDNK